MCLFVWAATGLFFDGELYPVATLARLAMPVVTVTAAMCSLIVLLGQATLIQTHASTDAEKPPKFIERLPPRLRRARLIAVQAEDHYLRVHTDHGSDLILMRLSDALEELEGLEGAQTHRSWWVAKDAVQDASRGDGRATLTLDGDVSAPVSRRYAKALREAGWY
jgi:DNA-binding LytR/AlgR family response regulator